MTEYRREICRSNRTINIYKKRLCHLRDYLFFLGGFFVVIASQFRFIYDLGTSPSLLLSLTGISLIYCSIIVKKDMIIQKRFFFLYIIFLIPLFSLTIIWLGYSGFNYKDFLKYLLIFLLYNNFYLLLGNLDNCDSRYIIKIYLIILFINSLLIYAQMLFSFVNIHLFLPGQRYGYSNGFVRPCGLFAEPSHFGMFAFGLVVIDVKTIKSKINFYVYAVIALLLTFSAVSYFVVFLLAIKYVLKAKNFKNIILFVFVILVVFASIVSFPQSKRVLSLLSIQDLYGDDSFLIRVVQGIATYNSLPIEKKFTGFGFRNTGKALNYYKGSFYNLFSISEEAGNALFYDFLSMGFLLSVFYQIYLFKIFIRKKSGIVIFIAFEIIRLGTDMSLISSEFLLMILLIISQNDLNDKCESTLRLSHRNKTKKAISSMVIDIE